MMKLCYDVTRHQNGAAKVRTGSAKNRNLDSYNIISGQLALYIKQKKGVEKFFAVAL